MLGPMHELVPIMPLKLIVRETDFQDIAAPVLLLVRLKWRSRATKNGLTGAWRRRPKAHRNIHKRRSLSGIHGSGSCTWDWNDGTRRRCTIGIET